MLTLDSKRKLSVLIQLVLTFFAWLQSERSFAQIVSYIDLALFFSTHASSIAYTCLTSYISAISRITNCFSSIVVFQYLSRSSQSQHSGPIRTRSKHMHSMPSAGKHPLVKRRVHAWFWFCFWLVEGTARLLGLVKVFPMLLRISFQFQKVYIWTVVDWVLLFLWNFFDCKVFFHKLTNKKKSVFFKSN